MLIDFHPPPFNSTINTTNFSSYSSFPSIAPSFLRPSRPLPVFPRSPFPLLPPVRSFSLLSDLSPPFPPTPSVASLMYLLELRMARKDRLVSVRSLKYLRHFNEQSNGSKLIFIHFIYPPFFHTFISHSQTPSLCKSPIRLNRSFSFLFVARPPPLPLILPNLLSILLFNFRRYFVSFVLFPVCFVF